MVTDSNHLNSNSCKRQILDIHAILLYYISEDVSIVELKKEKRYTYEDYIKWNDDVRREIINGEVYAMASPSQLHQRTSALLHYKLTGFLLGKTCRAYAAPFDVRLAVNQFDDIIVQPDLVVICDHSKLEDGKSCKGAPDMAVEIISESTARRDRITKLNLYSKAGIREYWIVDPIEKTVLVCLLEDGNYKVYGYEEADTINIAVLEDCKIKLSEIFE